MSGPTQQSWFQKKQVTVLLALLFAAALSLVDYLAGHEVYISAFYLTPICWACWVAGRRAGVTVALATAGLWLIADLPRANQYRHPAIAYWNALMLLALFLVTVYLLSAFQSAHLHLEATVQQRTAALRAEIAERKRLEAANLRAERLALVGTMAAEVAHEVRNPLGSLELNLDLIQKEIGKLASEPGSSPEESRVLTHEMREELHRIRNVLDHYLQFARLPKPDRQPLALNEWLEQKLALMGGSFEHAGVKLRTDYDPALPTVRGDAGQLWQATLNLIRNGLEAMTAGGELTVATWHEGKVGGIRVVDRGQGMTAAQLEQAFTPFASTKRNGTGLGLALAQQIATEHGGRIECESAVGQGSTFTIVLPLA